MPELHDYQRIGADHLRRNPAAGLMMEMGLGKSATTLTALTPDHFPALVIAPKRVVETVWPAEARLWRPDLTLQTATGAHDKRGRELKAPADITAISRDNFQQALGVKRWRTLIFDELSSFKAPRSLRFRSAKKMMKGTHFRWGLTGTPVPSGYLNLWAQLYLLDGGERLGPTFSGYRARYFSAGRQLPNGTIIKWKLRPGAKERIDTLISDICLAMSADDRIELPPVTYNVVEVPLPSSTRRAYNTLRQDLIVDLDLLGGVRTAGNGAILTSKLRQITAGFIYGEDDNTRWDVLHKEKLAALKEIVDGTGSPILVFYQFRAELDMIRATFPEARVIDEDGVIEAWCAGGVPLLLAHPASAGHGLNLQSGGHTIVWTSLPNFDEELWEQGNARLIRQGQTHPVVVHILESPHTVDVHQKMVLLEKVSVQDALLDHLESVI